MKTYNNLYKEIISFENLILAWKKARKGKTKKQYVISFENELFWNLMALHYELKYQTYRPRSLKKFVIRDPKTRLIHKSEFRDRVVHHAIVNVLEPIFDRIFIHDSCSNRKNKGNTFALNRFLRFMRKVSRGGNLNGWFNLNQVKGYCLKADIYHYFQEVDREILMQILESKIADKELLKLIDNINANFDFQRERERVPIRSAQRHASRKFNIAIFR